MARSGHGRRGADCPGQAVSRLWTCWGVGVGRPRQQGGHVRAGTGVRPWEEVEVKRQIQVSFVSALMQAAAWTELPPGSMMRDG